MQAIWAISASSVRSRSRRASSAASGSSNRTEEVAAKEGADAVMEGWLTGRRRDAAAAAGDFGAPEAAAQHELRFMHQAVSGE
jgi:hypothetical protein